MPPLFGYSGRGIYYQPELEHALIKGIAGQESNSLRRGIQVIAVNQIHNRVEFNTQSQLEETEHSQAQYVVDCSGGGSKVHRQQGVQFIGDAFKETWLVIDVTGDDYEGEDEILLDELIGTGFCVIGLNCEVEKELHKSDQKTLEKLEAKMISVSTDSNRALQGVDEHKELNLFSNSEKAILVLRPDRFVTDIVSPNPGSEQPAWIQDTYFR
ncbi:MAG: FAD-dependent monooxygenase [Pseudohongiellaceae bacterium]